MYIKIKRSLQISHKLILYDKSSTTSFVYQIVFNKDQFYGLVVLQMKIMILKSKSCNKIHCERQIFLWNNTDKRIKVKQHRVYVVDYLCSNEKDMLQIVFCAFPAEKWGNKNDNYITRGKHFHKIIVD